MTTKMEQLRARYTNEETLEPSMDMMMDELDEMYAYDAPRGEKVDLIESFIVALILQPNSAGGLWGKARAAADKARAAADKAR